MIAPVIAVASRQDDADLLDPLAGPQLSREQTGAVIRAATAAASPGRFVFITGEAGTGKSVILRALREGGMNIVVCAPTGLAALNVGGVTLHSMFPLKLGPNFAEKAEVIDSRRLGALANCDAIAIDEVGMVRADVLDMIDASLRRSLNPDEPFGGKTIIAFGDLWQLEPVAKSEEWKLLADHYRSPFFFDAHVFEGGGTGLIGNDIRPVELETIRLTKVFRQAGDPRFIDALNLIRRGDPEGIPYINEVGLRPVPADQPIPILCLSNDRAEFVNAQQLAALPGEERSYEAKIFGNFGKEMPCPKTLTLKVGARVMALRNVSDYEAGVRVVNGDIGTVVEFAGTRPVVEFPDGRLWTASTESWEKIKYVVKSGSGRKKEVEGVTEASVQQIPIKLAWGMTVHKSQGQTLPAAVLELESTSRTHGQTYVALSRIKNGQGLYLRRPLKASDLVVSRRVQQFFGLVPEDETPRRIVSLFSA